MRLKRFILHYSLLCLLVFWGLPVSAGSVPSVMDIPESLSVSLQEKLTTLRTGLVNERNALREKTASHNSQCIDVDENSPLAVSCEEEQAHLEDRIVLYAKEVEKFNEKVTVLAMNTLAGQLGWSHEELSRLDKALHGLQADLADVTEEQIVTVWEDILARGQRSDLAQKAGRGEGPGLPSAGQQTSFNDCAIFAVANATGRPYGVVAALAAKLVREGSWRPVRERENPQALMKTSGLNGGEVILLAEAFGQAEVIKIDDFAKTLKDGRSVMVNVIPESLKGGHEIVLTRTFQDGDATWFEMMDSSQGPVRRLYLTKKELEIIILENGVAFRPEQETTPRLLR